MFPFIELGSLRLPSYGLLLCVAILVGVQMAVARAGKHRLPPGFVYSTAALAVLVALLGSKITDWLIHRGEFPLGKIVSSGGTFLGGFLLASAATAIAARRARVPMWPLADSFAPALALGVAVVRVGCLAASCDYGRPTSLPWGIVFTNPAAAELSGVPLGAALHPSQIYESVLGLLILGLLLLAERKSRPPGFLFLVFALAYSLGRFLLEFLRGDMGRGFWGPFSTSQWLALATFVVFLVCYSRASRPSEA